MKLKLWAVLFFPCVLFWSGCSSPSSQKGGTLPEERKLKVLSTTAIVDDLVGQIGGKEIEHQALIMGDLDPHSYELVKGDDEKFSGADLVFANGLGLEHGASIRYWIEKHPRSLCLGDVIRAKRAAEIITIDRELDPHIWMDLALWSLAVEPVVEQLSEADPEHAQLYQQRGEAVEAAMQKMHQHLRESFKTVPPEKRFLVTSHDAFNYFARAYLAEEGEEEWQERFAAPEGLSPDGQLSPTDIRRIVEHLCRHQAGVVFPESNLSRDALRKVVSSCKEMGHEVSLSDDVLYGDAMGGPGSGADSYLKMMEHNTAVLLKTWREAQ